jgi:endonuclease/exonuclease/phosphatase family metal-dependent hydrolase
VRVLTWNLYHGRADPPAGRDLLDDFAARIAGWEWDVALLQEVPPWWPRPLAERARASMRMCITGRTLVLPVQRFLADHWPDLMKSWGGGSNAILVRGARIAGHRERVLRHLPERRWMHAVALEDGTWIGNLHAQTRPRPRPERDIAIAASALAEWSAGAGTVLLGGDFNIPDPVVDWLPHRVGHHVDHLLATAPLAKPERLEAESLSDHPPLLISLRG